MGNGPLRIWIARNFYSFQKLIWNERLRYVFSAPSPFRYSQISSAVGFALIALRSENRKNEQSTSGESCHCHRSGTGHRIRMRPPPCRRRRRRRSRGYSKGARRETAAIIRKKGREGLFCPSGGREGTQCAALVEKAVQSYGKMNGFVNDAGWF